jgi:hypothetical protein
VSSDGGLTWHSGGFLPVHLPGIDFFQGHPSICADSAGHILASIILEFDDSSYFPHDVIAVYSGSFTDSTLVWGGPYYASAAYRDRRVYGSDPWDTPQILCDPTHGYAYLAYVHKHGGSPAGDNSYVVEFTRSTDVGRTWSSATRISDSLSIGVRGALGPNGELYYVWNNFGSRRIVGARSTDFGATFGSPFVVGEVNDNNYYGPPYYRIAENRQLIGVPPIGCNTDIYGPFPDFPSIAIDGSTGPWRGSLYVSWTDYADYTVIPGSGTAFDQEPNNDFASATPCQLGNDISGFVSPESSSPPYSDPDFFYFDGTAGTMVSIAVNATVSDPNHTCGSYGFWGGTDLQHLFVIAAPEYPQTGETSRSLIYTLPSTGRYYLGIGPAGPYYISYQIHLREAQPLPTSVARDQRDIVFSASRDGGLLWGPKTLVNDSRIGSDQCHPSVSTDNAGRVVVAWYDWSTDTLTSARPDTRCAYSIDGGMDFSASLRLSSASGGFGAPWQVGDHLWAGSVGSGQSLVLWSDSREADYSNTNIYVYGANISFPLVTALPVSNLRGVERSDGTEIAWFVSDPTELVSLRLLRSSGSEGSAAVFEQQSSFKTGNVTWIDRTAVPGESNTYRLELRLRNGETQVLGPLVVNVAGIREARLRVLSGNPSRGGFAFEALIPQPAASVLEILDTRGRRIRTIQSGQLARGSARLAWDGRNEVGAMTSSGIYFARLQTGGQVRTIKCAVVR